MEIIKGIENIKRPFRNLIVTLGNFDGVHLGHQKIFKRVIEEASRIQGEGMVITFDPHPLKVLFPDRFFPLLTPFKEKMRLIEKSGIEIVLCIEFSLSFSEISPFEFIKEVLIEKIRVKKVIVGYNYHFGKGQKGDTQTLKDSGKDYGFEVEVVDPLRVGHTIVSSSKIKELIQNGEVEEASKLLGRDYSITGKVIEGAKRGKTLGFPTANIAMTDELNPKKGVYAVNVELNSQIFLGVANMGLNPTFLSEPSKTGSPLSLEVHFLDFDREIYGQEIRVNFKRRIREEIRFDSPSQLIQQIQKDIEWAKDHVFSKTR